MGILPERASCGWNRHLARTGILWVEWASCPNGHLVGGMGILPERASCGMGILPERASCGMGILPVRRSFRAGRMPTPLIFILWISNPVLYSVYAALSTNVSSIAVINKSFTDIPNALAIEAITLLGEKEQYNPASRNQGCPCGSIRKSKRL